MLAIPPQPLRGMDLPSGTAHFKLPHHGSVPLQYAVPAQAELDDRSGARGSHASYIDRVRRRKTPNGPVLDDYDITPTDRAVHMPATKHVLVSPSATGPSYTDRLSASDPWPTSRMGDSTHVQGQRNVPTASIASQRHIQTPAQIPTWDFPGGLDSVLNQALPSLPSQRYYLQYGSSIPTVLPATIQSHTGPTASTGSGLYGPYWPDGSFSPYRPAPIRDGRFYDHYHRDHPYGGPVAYDSHVIRNDGAAANHYNQHQYHSFSQTAYKLPYYDPASNFYSLHTANSMTEHATQPQPQSFNTLRRSARATFKQTPESSQYVGKERTFAWAQNVYLELIANVHKAWKHTPSQYKLRGQYSRAGKPLIFPRPPKVRSGNYLPSKASDVLERDRTTAKGVDYNPSGLRPFDSEPSRPTTAIFTPSRRVSEGLGGVWPSVHGLNALRSFSDHYSEKYRPTDRLPNAASGNWPLIGSTNIQTTASLALEALERLCQDESEPWIDGVLLAGCLAYGLEDYPRALKWFEHILKHDSAHVEAMSNLAAALLALDRRDEALTYWAEAVRLRPSYFEAVEHLIGLLCGDQRAREAVTIIELVERSLRTSTGEDSVRHGEALSDTESESLSRSSSINTADSFEKPHFDHKIETFQPAITEAGDNQPHGFGSSGFAISGSDNGRILALVHAKGNMLYALGDNQGAATAFEDAILIAAGHHRHGIQGLIRRILRACSVGSPGREGPQEQSIDPILLRPDQTLLTAKRMFPSSGELPGLEFVAKGMSYKAAVATTSNSLLSLAKIYQDGLSNATHAAGFRTPAGTRDILALYYLSLSLQPSPSTANNVGILLASVQPSTHRHRQVEARPSEVLNIAGVEKGSGIELALLYYNFGLNLDKNHAHLYTNLGSLLKDIGQLEPAIKMYERAVRCDDKFDIALANLANAVKDQGRIADAIGYYRRAVRANPDFAEAVCGLATALNSVCGWQARGGIYADAGRRDRVHVDESGMMYIGQLSSGWVKRVVDIVEKQLRDGETWGVGILTPEVIERLSRQLATIGDEMNRSLARLLQRSLQSWAGKRWEGSRLVRLTERANQRIGWQWYQDRYVSGKKHPITRYRRHHLPPGLSTPNAPTVLPFHTFTAPLSAKQVRQISQRNALRISVSTLRSTWLPTHVYPPPPPPNPHLNVGYVSSDFNNHPLAHLMQSIFGLHEPQSVRAICYATTKSDSSVHRRQIEEEAPVFHDASSWSVEQLVNQIVHDGVHILVNLNGYTRGAKNEVFAARPAPLHMSFMGFAGTLGAEWCDYIFADPISVPPETLSPWRRNISIEDRINPDALAEDAEDWVYSENLIYARDTFFCVDHKQSAPDGKAGPPPLHHPRLRDQAWEQELARRWNLRKELFPGLHDHAVILGNFNQLYKIDPTIFCTWLRILANVPNSILWLLRFPDLGEQNLLAFARDWASPEIAARIVFTDVAAKGMHITRASVLDLFLDTPECNAHTTAADVAWSGTPILTWGKWKYKMCSRMAGSILSSALPEGRDSDEARRDLIVHSEDDYLRRAIGLARGLRYSSTPQQQPNTPASGRGSGRLLDIRRMLWEGRWTSRLFDTKRWVRGVEEAYWAAWRKWEKGEGGDIWL